MASIIPTVALPVGVLVVEDEPLVRILAVATLTDAGYTVHESPDAHHAISFLLEQSLGVDILFTDIHMPGNMSGLELALCVRRQWPWISVIVTSAQSLPALHEMPEDAVFLPKPYGLGSLVRHCGEMARR